MKTSTLTLIYRDCSSCGQMTVTSSLPMTETTAPGFTPGQEVIWTGTHNLFAHHAKIVEVRGSWLMIFGETPADARTVYDIADSVTGVTVLGIPADQLRAAL